MYPGTFAAWAPDQPAIVAAPPSGDNVYKRILRDEYLTPLGPLDRAMEAMAPVTGMCSHA